MVAVTKKSYRKGFDGYSCYGSVPDISNKAAVSDTSDVPRSDVATCLGLDTALLLEECLVLDKKGRG